MTENNKYNSYRRLSVPNSDSYKSRDYINPTRKDFESKAIQGFTFEHYVQSTLDGKYTSFYIKLMLPSKIYIEIRIPLY